MLDLCLWAFVVLLPASAAIYFCIWWLKRAKWPVISVSLSFSVSCLSLAVQWQTQHAACALFDYHLWAEDCRQRLSRLHKISVSVLLIEMHLMKLKVWLCAPPSNNKDLQEPLWPLFSFFSVWLQASLWGSFAAIRPFSCVHFDLVGISVVLLIILNDLLNSSVAVSQNTGMQ